MEQKKCRTLVHLYNLQWATTKYALLSFNHITLIRISNFRYTQFDLRLIRLCIRKLPGDYIRKYRYISGNE